MKKLIFSTPLILAAAFGLAACMDTDAQYNIPQVDAPALVSTYPASGETVSASDKGELTLTVKYNKRVFFASSTYNKIQFWRHNKQGYRLRHRQRADNKREGSKAGRTMQRHHSAGLGNWS